MLPLVLCVAALAVSLLLLFVGAEKTLQGAVWISESLGVNKVIAGSVLVASITALPELMSSIVAVFWESSHLAFGNILGSNIYNVPLIVGLCGLVREFEIGNSLVGRECTFMVGLSAFLALVLTVTGKATWWSGLIFLSMYLAFIYYSIRSHEVNNHYQNDNTEKLSLAKAAIYMSLGGLTLLGGTLLLVRSALFIVEYSGIREFYVGLTIMTLGSILPEVTVSLFAALRGEHEISIGNVIGDNIITTTLVFGLVASLRPFDVSLHEVLATVPFVILVTLMLLIMVRTRKRVTKLSSLIMLLVAVLCFLLQTIFLL